jgi:hypothetical protein
LELNFGGSATEAGIYTKDATGASTTSGSLLWDSNLDYWKFFFGSSYEKTLIDKYYDGNPHNSFIRMHSYYGIFGLIVLFFLLITIAISNRKASLKLVLFGLLLLLLFRAYTEPILFPSSLDLFFLFMIALFFRKKYLVSQDRNLIENNYVN